MGKPGWFRGCMVTVILTALVPGTASAAAVTFSPRVMIASGHKLNGVACPAATFCVAVGSGGDVVTSSHPSGGAAVWAQRRIGGSQTLSAVACPSPGLCVVLGTGGRVLSSTHPSGSTWRTAHLALPKHVSLTAIACPSAHLCVITDSHGGVFTTTNPASGWHRSAITGQALDAVSCASTRLCVATTSGRRVLVSTRPIGGARAWRSLRVLPGGDFGCNVFDAVTCPVANVCLGAVSDGFGAAVFGTHTPTRARQWVSQVSYSSPEPRTNLVRADIACGSPSTCAADTVDQFGSAVLNVYGGPGTTWTSATFAGSDALRNLTDIACARTLCVAVDRRGGAIVGT